MANRSQRHWFTTNSKKSCAKANPKHAEIAEMRTLLAKLLVSDRLPRASEDRREILPATHSGRQTSRLRVQPLHLGPGEPASSVLWASVGLTGILGPTSALSPDNENNHAPFPECGFAGYRAFSLNSHGADSLASSRAYDRSHLPRQTTQRRS
jgi:hypothetical protein